MGIAEATYMGLMRTGSSDTSAFNRKTNLNWASYALKARAFFIEIFYVIITYVCVQCMYYCVPLCP